MFAVFSILQVVSAQDLTKLYAEARQAQQNGDLATAAQRYQAIIQLQPQMAEAYANLGNLYYQMGQAPRAKSVYGKALNLKPNLAGPQFFLGVIAFNEHDYPGALTYLKRAADLDPSNPLIFSYLGYTHYARAEFSEATTDLEKALAVSPADTDVLYHLSKSYSHLADAAFSQLQSRFPNSVYTALARGHLAESKEDWPGATEQYNIARREMPDNTRLAQKSGWIAAKASSSALPDSGSPDEVIDGSLVYKDSPPIGLKLREELTRWQSKTRTHGGTAQDVYLTAEGFQTLSYLSSLLVFELDPDSYRAHQLRAQMFEESNNDEGAILEYRDALKSKPELLTIHFAIGSLYWKNQQFDQALPELQQELHIDPANAQALYELGDISAFQGHADAAEGYFLSALKIQPSLTEARFGLEKLYTESGRYPKSLEQLQAVLKRDPSAASAHYRLALLYRKMGKPQDAERELTLFNQQRK